MENGMATIVLGSSTTPPPPPRSWKQGIYLFRFNAFVIAHEMIAPSISRLFFPRLWERERESVYENKDRICKILQLIDDCEFTYRRRFVTQEEGIG